MIISPKEPKELHRIIKQTAQAERAELWDAIPNVVDLTENVRVCDAPPVDLTIKYNDKSPLR